MNVLEHIPETNLAFPNFDGSPVVHLERIIARATCALEHSLTTSTTFRKDVEIRNKRIEGLMREAVSQSLSHSIATACQYYQAPMRKDSVATYQTIQTLIDGGGKTMDG